MKEVYTVALCDHSEVYPVRLGTVALGLSAYQLALANGEFAGTLEAWLASLKGERGEKGEKGAPGERGPAGEMGPIGYEGPPGPVGEKGEQGEALVLLGLYPTREALSDAHPLGNPGDAYAVGTASDNVIYIWDLDKGVWVSLGRLTGLPGEKGEQGDQGAPGEKGDRGDRGEKGEKGDPGEAGQSGTDGTDGAPGPNLVSSETGCFLTGLLKGTGGAVAAATPGVDYLAPGTPSAAPHVGGFRRIFLSASEPGSADGTEGDLWLKYSV